MLITKNDIIKKISSIPPIPESVKACIHALESGDLKEAAHSASNDLVLKKKIESIVNSAYFSLNHKVTDTTQLFTLLGVEMAKGIVLSYLVDLLAPKEWKIFKKLDFNNFQAAFLNSSKEAILTELSLSSYKKYSDSIALIPATVCLVDELLGEKKRELDALLESSDLDFGKILYRFTGYTLFSLAALIAKKWDLSNDNIALIKACECESCDIASDELKLAAASLHQTFFYIVSKSQFLQLNSFISFNVESVSIAQKNFERIQENNA